ncbi:MAG: tetratricopeptide repeat protein, partial [Deltaproteobacteria bacterium]|nr:tetratricopeptide repeat protein [Deltaproteobacteria bacterium]
MQSHGPLQTALSHYHSGSFQKSIILCREILQENPGDIEALHLLGLSRQGRQEYDLSIPCFEKIILLSPDKALGYFNLANAYYALRKLNEADLNYQMAAGRDSTDDRIYNNWGIVLRDKGALEQAVTCFQKAIQLNHDNANAYHNLGNVLSDLERIEGAVRCYRKAVQLNQSEATHYKSLGNALRVKGEIDEGLGILHQALGRFPNDPEIYYGLGAALKDKGQLDEAIDCYRKAIKLNPGLPETHYNLGNVYKEQNRFEAAKEQFQKALQLDPKFAEAYNNLGATFKETGEIDEALLMYRKALEIKPDFAEARWNMGLALLLSGNFLEGWEGYEWRWEKPDYKKYKRQFPKPIWQGEELSGQKILLHAEQGYGDTLQVIRYVPLVAARNARVFVECPRDLKNLFSRIDGVSRVIARGEPLPEFDLHCPLMTLPKVFGTTLAGIPQNIPYLRVDPDSVGIWQTRINSNDMKVKVGLVWAGNPEHQNDRNRSCSLENLALLSQVENVQFFSLQKGHGSEEAKNPQLGMELIDLTDQIKDFSDT